MLNQDVIQRNEQALNNEQKRLRAENEVLKKRVQALESLMPDLQNQINQLRTSVFSAMGAIGPTN